MQWEDLVAHDTQREWFRRAVAARRLASSFLFVGPSGIGKRTFARLLAKGLLCNNGTPETIEACGRCESCAQVEAGTHPDLIQLAKPADKAFIPIELLIGEREKRMREGLCHEISLKPYYGRRKIAIMDDADALNVEGANALLKTLEEPPPDSMLILVGSGLQRQLPTIRSRCQAIIFRPLTEPQLSQLLLRHDLVDNEEAAAEVAHFADGSLTEAQLLLDPELRQFRSALFSLLAGRQLPMAELVKKVTGLVDAAGKDAKVKRERLKLLLRTAASFYRSLTVQQSLHRETDTQPQLDRVLQLALTEAASRWNQGSHGATACWKRCLLAMEQVDRNANQASLLEAWASDLATFSGA